MIGLERDVPLAADLEQALHVPRVPGVLHRDVAEGEQHRVERKSLEAAPVHLGDGEAVPGDADEPDEPFLPRLDGGAQRSVVAQRQVPLSRVDEAMELEEVDAVDAQPLERAPDLLARRSVGALAGLRREEEPVAVLTQEGRRA